MIRKADKKDNAQLLELSLACPMKGDVGLCVDRAPDFFALSRLEGKRWTLFVADADKKPVAGCMAAAERVLYVQGQPKPVGYIGDLKVFPGYRDGKISSALFHATVDECRQMSGEGVPIYGTILAGNAAAERRALNVEGLPPFEKVGVIRTSSVSFLWKKKPHADKNIRIREAQPSDLDAMLALWEKVSSQRQLAPAFTRESLKEWIESSPSLGYGAYRVAVDPQGKLLGFLAFWDQDVFKHMQVTEYSKQLKVFRFFYNLLAPILGATPLPPAGGILRYLTAVNICIPSERADVLNALLLHSYREYHGKGYAFFTLGLDVNDPLNAALKGLMPQPMYVNVWVLVQEKPENRIAFDQRPIHYEIALV
jgi:GNAT superfamily N-acetyltransferase